MRILMTTDTVGGVWTYTRELVTGLLEGDSATRILLVAFGGQASEEQIAWLQAARVRHDQRFFFETTTLPLEWQQDNPKAYVYAEPLLRRLARSFQADLLHANQFCFGALPLLCPKVVVAHSDVLSWARAVRGLQGLPSSEWLTTYTGLVSAGVKGASVVVAPTGAMLADFQAGFGAQPRPEVIANGRSVKEPRRAKKLQAVTAGRVWDEAKGMAVLENLCSPMPVLIAGETTSSDASYDAGRLDRSALLGGLSEAATLELFAESAIYVMTSLYEPFGLAAVEAAQCGCAILARDLPSQREVWGEAALYFQDAESLASVVARLATENNVLRDMQGRALVHARTHYTRERMTSRYLDLYRRLLQSRNQPLE